MRKIIVTMWITLDGFIAGPKGEMDWVTDIYDETMGKYENDIVSSADTLLLGRVTYASFARAWPHVPDDPTISEEEKAYARKVNALHKIVFSKTLQRAKWNNSVRLSEIIPKDIEKWKREKGRDMVIYGSASIVQQLTNLGLIDEYQLLVHPLILGKGKLLFENIEHKADLKLVDSKTFTFGVVKLTYQPSKN